MSSSSELMSQPVAPREGLLTDALKSARDTKLLRIGSGVLGEVPEVFRDQFKNARAVIIADPRTFEVAGKHVVESMRAAQIDCDEPYLLTSDDLYAEFRFVEELDSLFGKTNAIPVAVGSGTINDLVKLASPRAKRQYMVVPTAASMDGYTAYGASITFQGSKQTFDCPAPLAVVADLDVICAAPAEMNASGYADLLAKVTAGADWIIADALGEEAIDPFSWEMVQVPLRYWVADPAGIPTGDREAIARLLEGLMMGGFAMQHHKTSRPASGAEHQFSHLWDMQHHLYQGAVPSHGFKVAIGTLSSAAMYEELYKLPLQDIDVDAIVKDWPDIAAVHEYIHKSLGTDEIAQKAIEEMNIKHPDKGRLREQLELLKSQWPELRMRLQQHLQRVSEIARMLKIAGAPYQPEMIGVTTAKLRESFLQAFFIRRRYTVLDLAMRSLVFSQCVEKINLSREAAAE